MAKTKIIMSARTAKHSHHPSSRHVAEKVTGGKKRNKKMTVKC